MSEQNTFDNYCVVDLFGHAKIAGKVTEQTIAGQGFIRVDVPATKRSPSFTRLYGAGAIYSITPVSEEIAMRAAESIYVEPVTVYIAPSHQLFNPDPNDDGGDDDSNDFNDRDDDE